MSALCTLRKRASPAGLSTTRRPRRSNKLNPSCCSSPRICWLTALCVRFSTSEAARRFCDSATARNAVSVLRGKRAILVSIAYQFGQNKSLPPATLGEYAYHVAKRRSHHVSPTILPYRCIQPTSRSCRRGHGQCISCDGRTVSEASGTAPPKTGVRWHRGDERLPAERHRRI